MQKCDFVLDFTDIQADYAYTPLWISANALYTNIFINFTEKFSFSGL